MEKSEGQVWVSKDKEGPMCIHNGLEKHCWPLKSMDLFKLCWSTYTWIFSIVNTTVLHDLRMVKSVDEKPWLWKNHRYGGPTISYTRVFDWVEGQYPNPLCCPYVKGMSFKVIRIFSDAQNTFLDFFSPNTGTKMSARKLNFFLCDVNWM